MYQYVVFEYEILYKNLEKKIQHKEVGSVGSRVFGAWLMLKMKDRISPMLILCKQ